MTQLIPVQELSPRNFGWCAALIGGATSIGGSAFLGTLITNVGLWYFLWQGLSLEQAYTSLGSGITSPTEVLSFVAKAASCFCGGYISAQYGNGHPLVQSAVSGVLSIAFYIVMVLGPLSQPGSIESVLLSLLTPAVSSLLGGYIYARHR